MGGPDRTALAAPAGTTRNAFDRQQTYRRRTSGTQHPGGSAPGRCPVDLGCGCQGESASGAPTLNEGEPREMPEFLGPTNARRCYYQLRRNPTNCECLGHAVPRVAIRSTTRSLHAGAV